MTKKLKIFSLPNKEVKYTRLQIESFRKHMDSPEVDFTVINGSIEHRDEINRICEDTEIPVLQFFTDSNIDPIEYGARHCRWFIENIVANSSDYILLIHPDMFFIGNLDYKKILSEKKISFVPRYHVGLFYIWEGVVLIDCEFLNSSGLISDFDILSFVQGPNGRSDGGGASYRFLEKMNPKDYGFFEFWNLHHYENDTFTTNLNGHASYRFNLQERKLMQIDTGKEGPILGNKTYPYEHVTEDYVDYYINNFLWLKEKFVSGYPFPSPVHIDIISEAGNLKNPFIIHFKSGSGYQNFFNADYQEKKLIALEQIVKR
jgi:hypothetical protein